MRNLLYIASLLVFVCSCDSGDVEEIYRIQTSGRTASLTASVSQWESLPAGYNLSLAAYPVSGQYASSQRVLSASDVKDGKLRVVLSGIADTTNTVELSVTNVLRKRVLTLLSVDVSAYEPKDTIRIECPLTRFSHYASIQKGVFDAACIRCHGSGAQAARDLYLTEDRSEAMLVDVDSKSYPGTKRVAPGDPEESLLHQILAEGGENILHVNHVEILHRLGVDTDLLRTFIDQWIKSLAP
ncbi:MAG: hypothetical protein J6035_00995 [Bacteroidaceae bacterium]|nr:hypothetical protein [Bacteroidaceae bacterium]